MIKQSAFLLLCMIPSIAFGTVAGNVDNREVIGWVGEKPEYIDKTGYRNIWNTTPYNNYVCIGSGKRCATGEFISPRHILTNVHVAHGCGLDINPECVIQTSDGKTLSAKTVFYGVRDWDKSQTKTGNDWAILEITTPGFCSSHYFWHNITTIGGNMWRAGFGQLRKLTPQDFDNIRNAYIIAAHYTAQFDDTGLYVNYQNIANNIMLNFQKEFAKQTGENFVRDYLFDNGTLKLIDNCSILERYNNNKMARHNCQSWPGDSGSSIQSRFNQIVLLHNSGLTTIGGQKHKSSGISTSQIFSDEIMNVLNDSRKNCNATQTSKKTRYNSQSAIRKIGVVCVESDLPPHASDGVYIKSASKKYDCSDGVACSCAATQCESGYYLVVNSNGDSQGWCYTHRCPTGQHLNIIDGIKTDTKCIDN